MCFDANVNGFAFLNFNLTAVCHSVQFSCSVVSDSLWPHEPQHARPPCPSPLPEFTQTHVHQVSDAIQPSHPSSVIPFSSCPQSLPASESFPMSQFFASGGQSIGVSASASVLPMNTQDWSPLGWTDWISLQSKSLLQYHSSKASILRCSAFFRRRQRHPTPVLLPGKSHGRRSLVGCSPRGC